MYQGDLNDYYNCGRLTNTSSSLKSDYVEDMSISHCQEVPPEQLQELQQVPHSQPFFPSSFEDTTEQAK